jgi:hypothetical protein
VLTVIKNNIQLNVLKATITAAGIFAALGLITKKVRAKK